MICNRCRKEFEREEVVCPHCGEPISHPSGVYQTSAVLISTAAAHRVYPSVDDVPAPLRSRLLKSTNSANSATILIADRRGRREIARAMRRLPGSAQRRLMRSVMGQEPGTSAPRWATPVRKRAILAFLAMLMMALIAFAFAHRW